MAGLADIKLRTLLHPARSCSIIANAAGEIRKFITSDAIQRKYKAMKKRCVAEKLQEAEEAAAAAAAAAVARAGEGGQ